MDHESIIDLFKTKMKNTIEICRYTLRNTEILNSSKALLLDSRYASTSIKPESIDMILTSPPYPNTYDYYLYHKHRMLWLGHDHKTVMKGEIGSRHEFSSKKQPMSNFTEDLHEILLECNKLLKKKSTIVIVIGDGVVRGELYDSKLNTVSTCESIGWDLVDSTFNNLDDISRSFNKNFRSRGKKEHILVFERG